MPGNFTGCLIRCVSRVSFNYAENFGHALLGMVKKLETTLLQANFRKISVRRESRDRIAIHDFSQAVQIETEHIPVIGPGAYIGRNIKEHMVSENQNLILCIIEAHVTGSMPGRQYARKMEPAIGKNILFLQQYRMKMFVDMDDGSVALEYLQYFPKRNPLLTNSLNNGIIFLLSA